MPQELKFNQKKYLELQEQEDIYLNKRRGQSGVKQVIYRSRAKETPELFEMGLKYTFLQYIHIVYEWAERKYNLTREEIDFILYIYPIGVFNKFQVDNMLKTAKMSRRVTLNRLIKKGVIDVWREKKGNQLELYKLTQKATYMCGKMHTMIVSEATVPSSSKSVFQKPKKATNEYYLNVIKEMNSKVGSDLN